MDGEDREAPTAQAEVRQAPSLPEPILYDIAALWYSGCDTLDIAAAIGTSEAFVANRLGAARTQFPRCDWTP